MLKKIGQYILLAVFGIFGYFLLSHHVIYSGQTIKLLKKSHLTSEYTFVSVSKTSAESILRIDTLREAGIGDLLVAMGRISKAKKEFLEKQFDSDPVYY
jgi:hypothetical protein